MINETLARRSKENMSFSDYKEGSATSEYNAVIQDAAEQIERAKERVSDEGKARLDKLLSWYKSAYATWINKSNANGAGHVSSMISGPSGFNHRKHEKYMAREGKLWEEYDNIRDISSHISKIITGDRIIKSDDVNAIEKLQEKIAKLEKLQTDMKTANAILRKKKLTDVEKVEQLIKAGFSTTAAHELLQPDFCGRIGFSYHLTNNNATIRTAKQRLEHIEKLATKAAETPKEELETEINGIKIIDNLEAQRLQIIFPGKPDADVRTKLKKNGFRWSPTHGAWQSYRSHYSEQKARQIVESL